MNENDGIKREYLSPKSQKSTTKQNVFKQIRILSFNNPGDTMNTELVEKSKTKLLFKVEGAGHTLCNIITKELWQDEHIKAAGYNVSHPLVDVPQMLVETDGKEDPKAAVIDTIKRIKSNNSKLLKSIDKFK